MNSYASNVGKSVSRRVSCLDGWSVPSRYGRAIWLLFLLLYLWMILGIVRDTKLPVHACLLAAAIIGGLCFRQLATGRDVLDFRLTAPKRLYGFFFALYYCSELLFYATDKMRPQDNDLLLAAIVLIGYAGWYTGMTISERRSKTANKKPSFDRHQSRALLWLCVFGALCVAVFYLYRLSTGQFYAHAGSFVQEPTVQASLIFTFCAAFELPVILIAGLLTSISDRVIAKRARYFIVTYSIIVFLIQILASHFRLALTTIVFFAASMQTAGALKLRWRHVVIGAAALTLGLAVISGTRAVVAANPMSRYDNQLVESAESIQVGMQSFFSLDNTSARDATASRAADPMGFLSDTIDAFKRGQSHLYGVVLFNSLYLLVPKIVWPSKPVGLDSQMMIEQYLGLPLTDATADPALVFYVDGGVLGEFFLFACFGLFMGVLTRFAVTHTSVFAWMWLIWLWSTVADVETDLLLNILLMTRQVLFTYCIYRLFYFFTKKMHSPGVLTTGSRRNYIGFSSLQRSRRSCVE